MGRYSIRPARIGSIMSLTAEGGLVAGAVGLRHTAADFGFLPVALSKKCGQIITAYHLAHGYSNLPHFLWNDEIRRFIAAHEGLSAIFRKASLSRTAKEANEHYVLIATIIVSLETLALDFIGWGEHFPSAKLEAVAIVSEYFRSCPTRLLDIYVPPRGQRSLEMLKSISPP